MTNAMVAHIEPQLMFLASALKLQLTGDDAGQRAVDRAVQHLSSALAYEFDGVELRITSASRRSAGQYHVTDGIGCTCESKHRQWCWHRAAFRLLFTQLAMADPMALRFKIVEQHAPADDFPPDSFLDSFDSYGRAVAA